MTRKELGEIYWAYFDLEKEISDTSRQFFDEYENNRLTHRATKIISLEEIEKLRKLYEELDLKREELRKAIEKVSEEGFTN